MSNCVIVPNFFKIAQPAVEIREFQYYASLAWKCLFMPPLWGRVGAHFPRMMSHIVLTLKRTVLGLNHVIWDIKREYRSRGSSWALVWDKRTGKCHKRVLFNLFLRNPHWSDVHKNCLVGGVLDVGLVTCAKFQNEIFRGYNYYRRSSFPFSYWFWNMGLTTVQRY